MRVSVTLAAVLLLAAPAHAFLLVGEDPAGDGNHSVLGAADVGDTISSGRTDILGLDVDEDAEGLTLRLRIAEPPSGTGGYLYRAVFEAGGTLYWTCWTVQWVANEVSEENVKGCSRFTEGTQVGPATTAEGVELGEAGGEPYVQWTVPRSSVGGAGVADLQNVFADTWFRGGSLDHAGSTVDSQYHWGRSDLGPDEGFWSIVVPAVVKNATLDLNVTLEALTGPRLLPPGGNGTLTFVVNATGAGNVTFAVEGVPANWTVEPTVANLTAPANATLAVGVRVPADADIGQTVTMTLVARAGNLTLASVPFVVEVNLMDPYVWEDEGIDLSSDADASGPGALLALAAVGVVAALRRRR